MFLNAVAVAAEQAGQFAADLETLRLDWDQRLVAQRQARGIREKPRADSAVAQLIELLPEAPLVTVQTTQRSLNVSAPAARNAVEELADAKILYRKQVS